MTRRIAWAILLSAWMALIIGGLVAYITTRQSLLAELDDSLFHSASSLPQLVGVSTSAAAIPFGDRYIIQNEIGQTVARPETYRGDMPPPIILARSFARLPGGGRIRTLTLSAIAHNACGGG